MVRLLLVAVLLLSGCYTAPKVENFNKSETFLASFDQTWAATVDVLSSIGVSVESIEKESGLITVSSGSASGAYCKCPGGLLTAITAWRGKFNVLVKSVDDSTSTVQINAFFEGFNEGMGVNQWVTCPSSGKLESEVFAMIAAKL